MRITFDQVYKMGLEDPAQLLKDYLIPGSTLKFGRRQGKWFWELVIRGVEQVVLPSVVTSISLVHADPGPYMLAHQKSYWSLINRPFKKGLEPFSRTISTIADFPMESLFTVIPNDFEVYLEILANQRFQAGLKDSAQSVMVITDHVLAADRLGRWFDAEQVELNPRQPSGASIYVGFTELPMIFRVPIYQDTFMPHLLQVPTDIVGYIRQHPDLLCRGMLVAGLSGSGKTTTVKKIVSEVLKTSKLSSLLIVDTKGEYEPFSRENGVIYLQPGKDLACLKTLPVNPFIPLRNLRLSSHIDTLALILGIGGAGGGGFLLPSFLKLLLEEFYFYLLHSLAFKNELASEMFERKLRLLNMTGRELSNRLNNDLSCFDHAVYQLINFWQAQGSKVIQRIFKDGGQSQGRFDIQDVISTRLAFLETSVLSFFPYQHADSFDLLKEKKICISLQGMSKSGLQQLMAVFCLLSLESILAGEESSGLKHLFLIEEAHHLAAASTGNSELLSTEKMLGDQIERALVEGRSKSISLILTDQQPGTRLLSCIAANTTLKVCHNLLGRDGKIMAEVMGLPPTTEFSTLGVGEAYIKPGDHFPAVRSRIRI